MGSTYHAGDMLTGPNVDKYKYEADDGDIKIIRVADSDVNWAGAQQEPAGVVNDLDSARSAGSKKRLLGERVRHAIFRTRVEIVLPNGATVYQRFSKKVPILTKAAFGTGTFTPKTQIPGNVLFTVGNGTETILVKRSCMWILDQLVPESNR